MKTTDGRRRCDMCLEIPREGVELPVFVQNRKRSWIITAHLCMGCFATHRPPVAVMEAIKGEVDDE